MSSLRGLLKFTMRPFSANVDPSSPFTIHNIPFGVFSTEHQPDPRPATVLGDHVIDLKLLESRGLLQKRPTYPNGSSSSGGDAFNDGYMFSGSNLNEFASRNRETRVWVRQKIIELLSDLNSALYTDDAFKYRQFIPITQAIMHLPMKAGGFTDFLTSRVHAENCANMAGQELFESFDHFPTAYNGRASSLIISGTPIPRPRGMIRKADQTGYEFAPSRRLDFELEMGIFISKPIPRGSMVTANDATEHIFGLVLLNDWSARDIQFAEMIPLGPFNGKATATSISPWIIMPEALIDSQTITSSDRAQLMHSTLASHLKQNLEKSTWDIDLEVSVVRGNTSPPITLCRSNLRHGFWSPAQLIAHHSSSGCGLDTGDLIGTGTLSGPNHSDESPSLGCLHELNKSGTLPIRLSGSHEQDEMMWLNDGDEVIFSGWTSGVDEQKQKIGFGDLTGMIVGVL